MENLLPVPEVSRRLGGVSKWSVYAWLSSGRLQGVKIGSRVMVRESELERFVNEGGQAPTPKPKN